MTAVAAYNYWCKTCDKVFREPNHAGRRLEHCPAHRSLKRPRGGTYHYTCRRCRRSFHHAAGGVHRKSCPGCAKPAANELRNAWNHMNGARPFKRCPPWVQCTVCDARSYQQLQLPIDLKGEPHDPVQARGRPR